MIECGEIYYITGNKKESTGHEIWAGRPGIVISSEEAIREQGTVNIIYLTSSENKKNFSVEISNDDFIYKKNKYECHTALCSQIHSVDKSRLGSYYGKLKPEEIQEIKNMIEKTIFENAKCKNSAQK